MSYHFGCSGFCIDGSKNEWGEFECFGEVEMNELIVDEQTIQNKIYTIRGVQVMLDRDLAGLYQVETKALNQAVKRNIDRFPKDFMFQLSNEEFDNWRSQFVTSNSDKMGLRRPPYAFTEQGVSMLSSVLKSKIAIDISIQIIRTFVNMRKFISSNNLIHERFERIEHRLSQHDQNFEKLFKAIEDRSIKPTQGIFYNGQIFDAYAFVADLIKSAKNSIILIDNHKQILNFEFSMLSWVIYNSKLIIQNCVLWFAFSRMNGESLSVLRKIKKKNI